MAIRIGVNGISSKLTNGTLILWSKYISDIEPNVGARRIYLDKKSLKNLVAIDVYVDDSIMGDDL